MGVLALGSYGSSGASAQEPFGGAYAGLGFGPVSYNTRIAFDGVFDPAGRGGLVYGVSGGYDHAFGLWIVGAEATITAASVPDPYTFDPAVTGFAELHLRRGTSAGLNVRGGYVLGGRVLVHAGVGISVATQSVRLDGRPLSDFEGGSEAERFVTLQRSLGVEGGVGSRVRLGFSFRSSAGHDLSADDFGRVVDDASLTFFDLEPSQDEFIFGVRFGL